MASKTRPHSLADVDPIFIEKPYHPKGYFHGIKITESLHIDLFKPCNKNQILTLFFQRFFKACARQPGYHPRFSTQDYG